MSRRRIVAGNWKMNLDLKGSYELISQIAEQTIGDSRLVLFPPFPLLHNAVTLIQELSVPIEIGSQSISDRVSGAYTGEVSASMVKSVGCTWTLVGHSERRILFGESNQSTNEKVILATEAGMNAMLCVGETEEQREDGRTDEIVAEQLRQGLNQLSADHRSLLAIAYEPVWAIGTGRTATPAQAEEVHGLIRSLLSDLWTEEEADATTILYGGSVKPENAAELFAEPDIDGALVGGASLDAESFLNIINA